ncbi:molecular chaperone Tir [Reichenbachiella versicolor]|uniref:molecular chaperone Tir n=1 Tax=Reichenbachiella versicolor TaxID=1821036 RepID=UPI000D6DC748|nr:molecular chaperone Tir [Reichenbachiella versicolor]
MNKHFQKVTTYLLDLQYNIIQENESEGVIVIENEAYGIKNVVLIIADPIVIVEQYLFELKEDSLDIFKSLLIKNRDIIHGAFALDDSGTKVLFRNTHECENLNLNELEATLNSLSLLLSEYSDQLINYSK